MADLVPVTRPNGKVYRPRRITVAPWENDTVHSWSAGVYVLGTHNLFLSRPLAQDAIARHFDPRLVPGRPDLCWVRDGFHYGDRAWVDDEVRGRAAVCWTAMDPITVPICGAPFGRGGICDLPKWHAPIAPEMGWLHSETIRTTDKEN